LSIILWTLTFKQSDTLYQVIDSISHFGSLLQV
jgi:hypothetical protein